MSRLVIVIWLMFGILNLHAQESINKLLTEIEGNNTGLRAFRMEMEARSLQHKTGIYPANPEFEYAWFSGSPSQIGNKTNISIRQHFHFPTSYVHKSRISNDRNGQLLIELDQYRYNLHLEARLLVLELIASNARAAEFKARLEHAVSMMNAYTKMFEAGECGIIDLNKAKLNYLDIQNQTEANAIENKALLEKLSALNGGREISFDDAEFSDAEVNPDFEQWFLMVQVRNPLLQWLQSETAISRQHEKLQQALSLPALNAGYVSEELTHEKFRGFVVGLTIPLWENKNTVKAARVQTSAVEGNLEDESLRFYHELKALHERALALQLSVAEYQTTLALIDNSQALQTAWEQGQINLISYLLELSFYYQSRDRLLAMELELHQTVAKLEKYWRE
jgi:cobalt-zinc-cadmium efflux system outer membrane protein